MAAEKSKSIGGLYNKISQKGMDYLNGFINFEGKKIQIVAFKNNNKFSETSPDYSIFLSEPMGGKKEMSMANGNANGGTNSGGSDPFGFDE